MTAAVQKVLQSKTFRRSPVLSRLLQYLVDQSLAGMPVKSYTIATEALGRSASDGADAETYARVAVARLRKALVAHYAAHPEQDEIHIDSGSYAVLLRSRAAPVAPDPAPEPAADVRASGTARRGFAAVMARHRRHLAVVAVSLLLLVVAAHFYDNWRSQQLWRQADFPTLAVIDPAGTGGDTPPSGVELDAFGNALRVILGEYFGFRLVEAGNVNADYEIRLAVDRVDEAAVETVALVEGATKRVVWIRRYRISDPAEAFRGARLAAAAIAAPGGALNYFGWRKGLDSDTPYGCWLRFTASVQSYSPTNEADLERCAGDWYAADKDSRIAAFLCNWTMVNASMTTLSDARRHDELEAALAVVNRALARSPDSGMLYLAEMRTYSFLGRSAEVRRAARSAIDAAPDNRVVTGMAGTWLVFWNDPMGKQVLSRLPADPDANLPWEHAGHFVAAMMEDDVEDAGYHLGFLRFYMADQPALNLLDAAYFRRTGRQRDAAQALDRIGNHPLAWLAGTDLVLERMPIAPQVRARLRQWLTYPVAPAGGQDRR